MSPIGRLLVMPPKLLAMLSNPGKSAPPIVLVKVSANPASCPPCKLEVQAPSGFAPPPVSCPKTLPAPLPLTWLKTLLERPELPRTFVA